MIRGASATVPMSPDSTTATYLVRGPEATQQVLACHIACTSYMKPSSASDKLAVAAN